MQSDWHTTTLTIYIAADNVGYVARLGTYISNCGDSDRLRAGPNPAVQMSTDLAQKKTKAEDSTSLKLHKKGDDANMTILVIKITKHWPPCLTWIRTKVQGDFYKTCPDSAKSGK